MWSSTLKLHLQCNYESTLCCVARAKHCVAAAKRCVAAAKSCVAIAIPRNNDGFRSFLATCLITIKQSPKKSDHKETSTYSHRRCTCLPAYDFWLQRWLYFFIIFASLIGSLKSFELKTSHGPQRSLV